MAFSLKNVRFNNTNNEEIICDLRIPTGEGKFPVGVFLHGFKSFRNWGFIPYFCERLAENGVISINVDDSLDGITDSEKMIFNESKFRRQTVSQYIDDVKKVIREIKSGLINSEIYDRWNGEICLIGHSLGGAVAILISDDNKDINKIVTLGTISKLNRNSNRHKGIWKQQGYADIRIGKTEQTLKLNYTYAEDKENYDDNILFDVVAKLNQKIIFLHGAMDLTVKKAESIELYDNSNKQFTNIFIIEKTGHTFGIGHPFSESSIAIDKCIDLTIKFLFNNE